MRVLGLVGLALGGLFWMRQPVWSGDWRAPQQTLHYADGGRLEVFGAALGEYLDSRVKISKWRGAWLGGGGAAWTSNNTISGTRGYRAVVRAEEADGHLIGCRTWVEGYKPLMISVRQLDRGGAGVEQPTYLSAGEVQNQTWGWRGGENPLGAVGTSREEHRAALGDAGLGLLVQHKDPVSGWVNLEGPFKIHDGLEGRHLVALFAWQRDQRDLMFRAIRADGAVVDFSLPNPDYQIVPCEMAAASPLPALSKGADFEVRVVAVESRQVPDSYALRRIELEVGSGLTADAESEDVLRAELVDAADEWGNRVPIMGPEFGSRDVRGFGFPGDSRRADVRMHLRRGKNYPWSASESVLIAEGTVSADGTELELKLLPGAAQLGISTPPWTVVEASEQLMISYEASLTDNSLKAAEASFGEVDSWQLVFFGSGSEVSGGTVSGRSWSGSYMGDGMRIERAVSWKTAQGALRPGEPIRVGVARMLPTSEVVFPLELPTVEGAEEE